MMLLSSLKSLRAKTFILSILFIGIMFGMGAVLFVIYEKETRDLLLQRDRELARVTALRLSESLTYYFQHLQRIALRIDFSQNDSRAIERELKELAKFYHVFDAGGEIYDASGFRLFAFPHDASGREKKFPDPENFRKVTETLRPAMSNIVKDIASGDEMLLLSVPIINRDNQIDGVLVGRTMLKYSLLEVELAKVLETKSGHTAYAYLVDGNGFVVHHRENDLIGKSLASLFPVKKVMLGMNGAIYSKDPSGSNIICGFAQVPGTSWGVITRESWIAIVGPMREYGLIFMAIICMVVFFMGFSLLWGMNTLLYPVKVLTRGAQEIARGMFDCKIDIHTGDEIQELAEQFTKMAAGLKASRIRQDLQMDTLRKSHLLLHSVIESPANFIIFSLDTQYKYTAYNSNHEKEMEKRYDFRIEKGISILDIIDDDYLGGAKDLFDRVLDGKQLTLVREWREEANPLYYEMFFNRINTTEGRTIGLTVFAIDITHRKNAETGLLDYQEKLRSLSNKLLLAEEEERRQISLELHERIGHSLASASMKLGTMGESLDSPDHRSRIDEIDAVISQTIQDTRVLTFEISPPILYDFGLRAGVDWLIEQTSQQHGLEIEFEHHLDPGTKKMDSGFRVLIYRAIRELLFNIVKHARTGTARVFMVNEGEDIRITVTDHGVGFDVSEIGHHAGKSLGFGLFSIRERLSNLGGYLDIESTPGHGTRMTMVCPIEWKKESAADISES
jgi:signal transduction histidine kinase